MSFKKKIIQALKDREYFLSLILLLVWIEFVALVSNALQSMTLLVGGLVMFVYFFHRANAKQIEKLKLKHRVLLLLLVVYQPFLLLLNYLGWVTYAVSKTSIVFDQGDGRFDFPFFIKTLKEENPDWYSVLELSTYAIFASLLISLSIQLYMTFKTPPKNS